MRQSALELLILLAAPTIAWGDAEDKLKCEMLVSRGKQCVEFVWQDYTTDTIKRGPLRECLGSGVRIGMGNCRCNRKAYQDFGFGERTKYHWCKARY